MLHFKLNIATHMLPYCSLLRLLYKRPHYGFNNQHVVTRPFYVL